MPHPRIPPLLKSAGEDVLMYAIAGAIVWYESRGLSFRRELADLANVRIWRFVPASLASFLIWFLGDNLLFARLFTLFDRRTGFVELLPATAAAYFLQTMNVFVASGAFVLFLHQRKQVPWFAGGFTIAFLGFIDGIFFSAMIALTSYLDPHSPLHSWAAYSTGALVALLLIAAWWLWRRHRTPAEQWLYARPSLMAFRSATLAAYAELLLIRLFIFAPQGILLWICLDAFNLTIGLKQVMIISPAIFAAGGASITPAGLGPMQAVAVRAFSNFESRSNVMAAMLAFSLSQIIYRLPLGIGAAHGFVRRVIRTRDKQMTRNSEPARSL
jgi:Lysylphosphatidylglycerol synthase TM region